MLRVFRQSNRPKEIWRNGLGSTSQLCIYPFEADHMKHDYIWRFCELEVLGDFSYSVLPDYDVCSIFLPKENIADEEALESLPPIASLYHNDLETPVQMHPLRPYTYNGSWPTICKTKKSAQPPLHHLFLGINRKRARMSVSVEAFQSDLGSDNDSFDSSQQKEQVSIEPKDEGRLKETSPGLMSRILLGHFTIVYVAQGRISASVEGDSEEKVLEAGDCIFVERQETSSNIPMELIISNVGSIDCDGQKASVTPMLITIQIDLIPLVKSLSFEHNHSSLIRTTTGSVLVSDDMPNLSQLELDHNSQFDLVASNTSINATSAAQHHHMYESAKPYKPPVFSARYQNESKVPPPVIRDTLNIEEYPRGIISTAWINMVKQGLSEWIRVPVIIARGMEDGPVVGITAAMHGNELNGVPCIHRVITDIDVNKLKGTVVAIPCVNVPGYLRFTREFSDGKDLNRLFPGKAHGTASQVYAFNLMHKIMVHFNYLIDLHTASFGRVNSYYVRADMNDPVSAAFAKLQQPQIILHNSGQDGTLRSACMAHGIKSITVEIGNPHIFQNQFVQWSYLGVMRILNYLGMFTYQPLEPLAYKAAKNKSAKESEQTEEPSSQSVPFPTVPGPSTILCSRGFWIYTQTGGVLEVYPAVNTIVKKGTLIARIKNIFGNIVDEIYSPNSGITIGRSSNPVAMAGDRVLHLGVIKKIDEALANEAKENY